MDDNNQCPIGVQKRFKLLSPENIRGVEEVFIPSLSASSVP